MIKLLGALCFVFAGAIYGAEKSSSLKNKCTGCREIRSLIVKISILIRYRGLNVYEIVRELKASSDIVNLSFIENLPSEFKAGSDFHKLWCTAVENDISIGKDESKILCKFGNVLGTSDIEGQLLSIESILEELKNIEQIRQDEYRRKGKLYRSLGVLFGVMTGILLI